MQKFEKKTAKKPEVEQKHRVNQNALRVSAKQFHGGRQNSIHRGETPFQPPVTQHLEMLSEAGSIEERATVMSYLQHSYGNRYVQRLVESMNVQPKLTISSPGDIYEREADRVAKTVTGNIRTQISRQGEGTEEEEEEVQTKTLLVQRNSAEEEEEEIQTKTLLVQRNSAEEEEESVQTKPDGNASIAVSQELEGRINALRGNGHPLAGIVREPMEKAFGADFSEVHVHTDPESDTLNRGLSAKAFTTGQDIFFREGEYSPGSGSGQELIAHELTHVVQQSGNKTKRKSKINRKPNQQGAFNVTTDTIGMLIQQKETGAIREPKEPSLPKPETGLRTQTRPIPPATTTVPTTPSRTTKPTARARLREATKPSKPLPPIPGPVPPERPLTPALKRKILISIDQLVDARARDIGAHVDTLPEKPKVDQAVAEGQELQEETNQLVEKQSGPVKEVMKELVVEDMPPPEKGEPSGKGGAIEPAGGGTSDIAGKLAEGRDWVHTTADFVMEGLQAGMVGSQKVLNILGHISGAIGIFFTTIMSYLDIRAIFRSIKRMWDLSTILNESVKKVEAQGNITPEEREFVQAIMFAYKQKVTKVIRKVLTLTAGLIAAGTGIAFWTAGGIVAAANAWNPVGWGLAVALLATGIVIGLGVLGHKIYKWIKKGKKRGEERTKWATKIFEQGIAPGGRLKSQAQKAIDSLKIRKATGFLGTLKSFFWKGKGDVITAAEMEQAYNQAEDQGAVRNKFIKGIAGKLSTT